MEDYTGGRRLGGVNMETKNFAMGVAGIVIFIVLMVSLWDFINYIVGMLSGETTDPWSAMVIILIPFAIIVAGAIGVYRLFKGRFGT